MSIYIQILSNTVNKNKYFRWYSNIINNAIIRSHNKTESELKKLLGYIERHHILPICICSTTTTQISDKENIVRLTAREHFICHWILIKLFPLNVKLKYALSSFRMNKTGDRKYTSRQYETIRKYTSIAMSEHNTGKVPWNKGIPWDEETKNKIGAGNKHNIPWNKNKTTEVDSRIKVVDNSKYLIKHLESVDTHWNAGFVTAKDLSGNTVRVIKSDPRLRSGELVGATKGQRIGDENPAKRESVRLKISENKKSRPNKICIHCNTSMDGANFSRYHGDNCKLR